jgi:hypothetical protein
MKSQLISAKNAGHDVKVKLFHRIYFEYNADEDLESGSHRRLRYIEIAPVILERGLERNKPRISLSRGNTPDYYKRLGKKRSVRSYLHL